MTMTLTMPLTMPRTTLLLCWAALLAHPTAAQKRPRASDMARAMHEMMARYEPFGFQGTVLVGRAGKPILARGYGLADADTGRANDARTLFEIASISKSFTAAAILKLEEMEKLSTDDPIDKHLPAVPEHSQKLTIHHLLTHTSGVPGRNTKGRGDDLERAVADFLGDGPAQEPGAKWEYWNGGYALLAGIVERASGTSYAAFCRKHLFEPAGMKDTGFTGSAWLDADRAAVGVSKRGAPRSALEHPYGSFGYQYRGMGGVVTTALDLLKWDRALAAGVVLGKDSQAKLFRPVAKARGAHYAYGWFVSNRGEAGPQQQHGGSVRGFMSDYRRLPDHDACIAILTNCESFLIPYIAENLVRLLLGKPPRHEPPPALVSVKASTLKRYAGTFEADGGRRLLVRVEGNALRIEAQGEAKFEEILGRGGAGVGASVEVQPLGDDTFLHWAYWGSERFEFDVRGRRVRALSVGGKKYAAR